MSNKVALGGVTAALAVIFLCLGTVIPLTTFVWPMACMLLLCLVMPKLDSMIWTWYTAVAILGMLLSPDKEAAALFVFLGWYPIIKLPLERYKLRIIYKALIFNTAVFLMYWLLISLLGMAYLKQELFGEGLWLTGLILLLGNAIFFMLDRILGFLLRMTASRQ